MEGTETESLKDIAFRWYTLGFNIVLLKNKRPIHQWGKWETKRQSISDFELLPWTQASHFAIVCGTKINNVFLGVIDVDFPDKLSGFKVETFKETFLEQTPRGGYHVFFWSRNPVKTTNYLNFELKGKGGLCTIYGSEIKPIFTLEDLSKEFEEQARKYGLASSNPLAEWSTEELLNAYFLKGERDKATHILASKLRAKGTSREEVEKILLDWNERNEPPLSSQQILEKVESAFKTKRPYYTKEEEKEHVVPRPTIITPEFIAEQVWDRKTPPRYYVKYFDGRPDETKDAISLGELNQKGIPTVYVPVDNGVLRKGIVIVPARPQKTTFKELFEKAENFVIQCYDSCGREAYVKQLCHLCIGSWFLDRFVEDPLRDIAGSGKFAPILPIRGPSESGKNRLAFVLRLLSYRPYFEISTYRIPSLYRPLDLWRGTLILDEADFAATNEKSELTHYLNGRATGSPLTRQDPNNPKITNTFHNFGLTILTQRKAFDDNALESRSIPFYSEKSDKKLPTLENDEMLKTGLELQNMLLFLRLEYFQKVIIDKNLWIEGIRDPRLTSSLLPLLALSKFEPSILDTIKQNAGEIQKLKIEQKSASVDGMIINTLWERGLFGSYNGSGAYGDYYFQKLVKLSDTEEDGFVEDTIIPLSVSDLAEELKISPTTMRKVINSLNLHNSNVPRLLRVGKKPYRAIFFEPSKFEKRLQEFVIGYREGELGEKLKEKKEE